MKHRYAPHETHFRTHEPVIPVTVVRDALSPRDKQLITELLRTGGTDKELAFALGLSEATVKVYWHHMRPKLQAATGVASMNRVQIALWAERSGKFTVEAEQ
jgi:DNA-binding NarL/FixJ family response regulator